MNADPYMFSAENPVVVFFIVVAVTGIIIYFFIRFVYRPLAVKHIKETRKNKLISNQLFYQDPNPIIRFSNDGELLKINLVAKKLLNDLGLEWDKLYEDVFSSKSLSKEYLTLGEKIFKVSVKDFPELNARQVYLQDYTNMIRLEKLLSEYEMKVTNLLTKQEGIFEEKLKNIARELHDNVNHELLLVMKRLENDVKNETDVKDLGRTIDVVRNISNLVKPIDFDTEDFGFALYKYFEKIQNKTNIKISHSIDKKIDLVDSFIQKHLYRIIQECISNAIKHAYAQNIEMNIYVDEGNLLLFIEDDGKGFKPIEIKKGQYTSEGLGIVNIQERIKELGGSWEIDSHFNSGTSIIINLPMEISEVKSVIK